MGYPASVRVMGAGALAALGGFVFVTAIVVAGSAGGGSLVLGWFAALGGVACSAALLWAAHALLPSPRPWRLAAYGALGAVLALVWPYLWHGLAAGWS